MANPCKPWWLQHLLAAGVVLPIAAGLGLVVHSVSTDEGWGEPGSGACLGVSMFAPVLLVIAALAWWAAARRDAEAYRVAAGFFALVAAAFTVSLGEAAAVGLGLRDGRVPAAGLAFVGGVWVYAVLVGLGHWHLYRVFRPLPDGPAEPGAAPDRRPPL